MKTKIHHQERKVNQNTQKFSERKKQFQETILFLKRENQTELKKIRKELESVRRELKKTLSLPSVKKEGRLLRRNPFPEERKKEKETLI